MMTGAATILNRGVASVFDAFAAPVTYRRQTASFGDLPMAIRGLRADDLFGAAMQGDRLAVVRAVAFLALVGGPPQKFDAVITPEAVLTVQEWRQAPATGDAVFFRLLLRGGTQ